MLNQKSSEYSVIHPKFYEQPKKETKMNSYEDNKFDSNINKNDVSIEMTEFY